MKESNTKLMRKLLAKGVKLSKGKRVRRGMLRPLFTHKTNNGKFYQIDLFHIGSLGQRVVTVYRFSNSKDPSAWADAWISKEV
jgi:hypothetical protein